jgi:hypothetical protein
MIVIGDNLVFNMAIQGYAQNFSIPTLSRDPDLHQGAAVLTKTRTSADGIFSTTTAI